MNPPLLGAPTCRVRKGLPDGALDVISTDHAPHSPEEKKLEFDAALNGVLGLETAFPVCLDLVRQGRPHREPARRGAHRRRRPVLRAPRRDALPRPPPPTSSSSTPRRPGWSIRCAGSARAATPPGRARPSPAAAPTPSGGPAGSPARGGSGMRKATLVLADGATFEGRAFGREETVGEVVFNTSMFGYQEDPDRPVVRRADVTMAYPHRATSAPTWTTRSPRDLTPRAWWCGSTGAVQLALEGVAGRLPRPLEDRRHRGRGHAAARPAPPHHGAQMGVLSTEAVSAKALHEKAKAAPGMEGPRPRHGHLDEVGVRVEATPDVLGFRGARRGTDEVPRGGGRLRAEEGHAAVPGGRRLSGHGGAGWTTATQILDMKPDGVFLTNGPGDPAAVKGAAPRWRRCWARCPSSASAWGTRILARALGGKT